MKAPRFRGAFFLTFDLVTMSQMAEHSIPSGPLQIAHGFAYYLPQYHVIPENEEWWGEGFTEWTKLRAARQIDPRQVIQTPGELGWYVLTDVSVIGRQYELARPNGIDTFAFWHYWFDDGDLLLEKPAERLLASDVMAEFCFAWANHDWLQRATGRTLRKQCYSGDAARHFAYLEPFFHDRRYRRIDGKPVFILFSPSKHPELGAFVDDMQRRAVASGLPGLFFVFDHTEVGDRRTEFCDSFLNSTKPLKFGSVLSRLMGKLAGKRTISRDGPKLDFYKDCVAHLNRLTYPDTRHWPVIFPGWDTSIRHGALGQILLENSPDLFGQSLDGLIRSLAGRPEDRRVVMVKSWNEWAEGNLMEPSAEFGRAYLETLGARLQIGRDAHVDA